MVSCLIVNFQFDGAFITLSVFFNMLELVQQEKALYFTVGQGVHAADTKSISTWLHVSRGQNGGVVLSCK